MPSNTPLTDAINALTQYANETTGASDTTLSDAVGTLVAGYGGGGLGDYSAFPWIAVKNGTGTNTYTSSVVTCKTNSVKCIFALTETKFSDTAGSGGANGTVRLQGSNDNSTWVNVSTLNWTTSQKSYSTSGVATGYKYYRFQATVTATGSNWAKIGCSGFIAYQ